MTDILVHFTLNGVSVSTHVLPGETLLECLRQDFGLTGAKEGCANGDCGACVVLMDNRPVNSCLVLAPEVEGHTILTIEGLAKDGKLHELQRAFLEQEAFQCGYCTPGAIMTSLGLLLENPHPSEQEIQFAMSGNLCRCTGYDRIIKAISSAKEMMQ